MDGESRAIAARQAMEPVGYVRAKRATSCSNRRKSLRFLENIVENHLKDSNDVSLWSKSIPVESALTPYLKGTFKEISKLCKDLDLKITGAPVMRISSAPSAPTYGRMVELLKDISSRMADEL